MATLSAPRRPLLLRRTAARARVRAVGVDLGGTWLRIAIELADDRVRELVRRSPRDPDALARILRRLWRQHGWTRPDVATLVVASRGVWTRDERSRLARRLRGLSGRVRVVSDAQAALLGALDGRSGVLILAGTGSIVVGRDRRGRWARAGGLGPLLGDEGSAFWIGREWMRAASGNGRWHAALAAARAPEPVARIAALAPMVLGHARRGHEGARRIVRRAHAGLAAQTEDVIRQLGLEHPVDASWAGGVLANTWFRAGLLRTLARRGLVVRWQQPGTTPLVAALRIAEGLSSSSVVGGRRGRSPRPSVPRARARA